MEKRGHSKSYGHLKTKKLVLEKGESGVWEKGHPKRNKLGLGKGKNRIGENELET